MVVFCSPWLQKHAYADSTMSSRVSDAWVIEACVIEGSPGRSEDQAAGGHACSRRDEHVLDVVDLVVGSTAHLAHTLGDAVHAVDIGLAEQPAVGVDRQLPTERQPIHGGEVLGFTTPAETEFLELREHERREMVVDEGGLDVLRLEARVTPQPVG